jgi:isopenicillin N synthase-like dioxygenase
VKPLKGSITVNVLDTLSFITGGYLESSIHRVLLSLEDQRDVPRYGIICFSGPDDSTLLEAVKSLLSEREKLRAKIIALKPPQVEVPCCFISTACTLRCLSINRG